MKRLILCLCFLLMACIGSQSPAPVTNYGMSKGPGSNGAHTVVSGDTLWSISQRYNISMQDIVYKNKIMPPYELAVGQRLILPPPREYRVRPGDTLYRVSRIHDVSMSELARHNNLRSPYVLQPGQVLRLPSSSVRPRDKSIKTAAVEPQTTPQSQKPSSSTPPPSNVEKKASKPTSSGKPSAKNPLQPKVPKRSSGKFLKPVSGKILSSYGPKKNGLHNDGINIAARRGTPVKAAENGVVVYAGNALKGSGNLVLLRHDNGWMSAYAHMDKITTKKGAVLKRGAALGTVGSTGAVETPQLHFEIRKGTNAVNPGLYLEG